MSAELQKASSLASKIVAAANDTLDTLNRNQAALAYYNELGGAAALDAHFDDGQGGERTDLPYTKAELVAAVTTLMALSDLRAAGHGTNLSRVRA
jgi:hypothetical protein